MRNTQEDEVDLGLSLGCANYRAETRLITKTGAGVNANSDIAFAASNPVSELVWSPHNGLSLKCADPNSISKEKPLILWNVDHEGASTSLGIKSRGIKDVDGEKVENSRRVDEAGPSNQSLDKNMKDGKDKCACVSKNFQSTDTIEDCSRTITAGNTRLGQDRKLKGNACKSDTMGLNVVNLQQPRASRISEDLAYSLPNIKCIEEPDDEVTSCNNRETNERIPITPLPIDAIPLDKLECSAENDLAAKGGQSLGKTRHNSTVMFKGIFSNQEKGKEKVLSEGDNMHEGLLDNDDEDSHDESVESCTNMGFFSKGIKRHNYDEDTSVSRKRMKCEGSFANWMSNMVNGLSCGNKGKDYSLSPSPTIAQSNGVQMNSSVDDFAGNRRRVSEDTSKGFLTVFRSLYFHTKMYDVGAKKEEGYFIEEPKDLNVAEQKLLESTHPCDGKNIDYPCMQIIVSNKEANQAGEISPCEPTGASLTCEADSDENKQLDVLTSESRYKLPNLNEDNPNLDMPGKSNNLSSLWITRFCSRKVITEQEKAICTEDNLTGFDQKTSGIGHDFHKSHNGEASFGLNSTCRDLSPLARSPKTTSPDEMASTFAKRLDALKHIVPSDNEKEEHGSNYDVKEENQKPNLVARGNGKTLLHLFNNYLTWNVKESSGKRPIVSTKSQKGDASNIEIHREDDKDGVTIAPLEMFHAISKLRLSRSDILRCVNSNVSTKYLDGFFLRLRLGKLDKGISIGKGYYVGCITGDTQKGIGLNSTKSILVDVGGIKTSVETQYISNHDFLEDEIKDWWVRTVKSGGKIPSLHELKSKFEVRKSLGF